MTRAKLIGQLKKAVIAATLSGSAIPTTLITAHEDGQSRASLLDIQSDDPQERYIALAAIGGHLAATYPPMTLFAVVTEARMKSITPDTAPHATTTDIVVITTGTPDDDGDYDVILYEKLTRKDGKSPDLIPISTDGAHIVSASVMDVVLEGYRIGLDNPKLFQAQQGGGAQ